MVISIYDRFNDKQNRISNMLYGSYLELALVITQLIFRSEKLKDMLHRIAIFQTSENENEFSPEVHITFILIPNSSVQSTIILTSHYMEDVKELCKRVLIIDKGKLLYDGQLANIVQTHANFKLITIMLDQDIGAQEVGKLGNIKEYAFPKVVFAVKRADANTFAAKILQKFPIADITITDPSIEAIVRGIFKNSSIKNGGDKHDRHNKRRQYTSHPARRIN